MLQYDELPRAADGTVEWQEVFGAHRPLRLEIGVGNSPFLLDVSRLEPDYNYLGLEHALKRVFKFLRKLNESGLENVRILPLHSGRVLRDALRPESVEHLFINFPDPWPKRRHVRKRLVQPPTVARIRDLLRPGGGLSLRTDLPEYAFQMLEVADRCSGLRNLAGPGRFSLEPRYPFPTPFELFWRDEGRRIFHLEYERAP
ncbi:MAG TPA: tRNA (guanosine(46)-N7)-methyltransferase TrmB [Planctomycetota bacterium]|nr:tRNA (guanosine(46)-N7)-methyltransferase TrmB [Planctomycetota bacterium]